MGPADLLFLPYSSAGASLDGYFGGSAPAGGKYVTSSKDHAPNISTSWMRIRASRPVAGFTLLGEENGRNLAGLPALSMPCGRSKEGLPIGMQLIGKHMDEETILRVGYNYEVRSKK